MSIGVLCHRLVRPAHPDQEGALTPVAVAAAVVGGLTADRVPTVIPGFGLADYQVLAHRLAGTPDRADDQARRMRAASADLPGPARLMGLVVTGHAALAGGRVRDALLPLRDAWAGLADSGHEFRFRCRTLLATTLAQADRIARLHVALAGAAGSDPDTRAQFEQLEQQRLAAMTSPATLLSRRGDLRRGLTIAVAADIRWLHADPVLYHQLVHKRQWTPSQFRDWLAHALQTQLLQ